MISVTILTPRSLLRNGVLIVLMCMLTLQALGKRKDDIVVMKNGDRFTGEIKGFDHGELLFKCDYMTDSVRLDWQRVAMLESKDSYIVLLTNGDRVVGKIGKLGGVTERGGEFQIVAAGKSVSISPEDVIGMQQREANFWNQLTGSISYGLNFSSDNTSVASSLGVNVAYYAAKNSIQLSTSSQTNLVSEGRNTNRFTFDAEYARMLTRKWMAASITSLLKSNQQDLDLRSTWGGGIGRRLVQTNRTSVTAQGGIVYTHERYNAGAEPVRGNIESIFGITFSTFRFKTLDVSSKTMLFPSLSDRGRFRLNSQSNLRIEIVRNFYWDFQLYENFDSRPPITAPRNDFGATTSVGWKF